MSRIFITDKTKKELERIKHFFDLRTTRKTIEFISKNYMSLHLYHQMNKNVPKQD